MDSAPASVNGGDGSGVPLRIAAAAGDEDMVTLLLQHGVSPASLARTMGRQPGNVPASVIGAIADTLAAISNEYGAA